MEKKTNYQISISVNKGIVEIILSGWILGTAMSGLHSEIIDIIKKENSKAVLCDARALTLLGSVPLGEIYFVVRSYPAEILKIPCAIVYHPSLDKTYRLFFDVTAYNAHHNLEWFLDIDMARAHLKSKLQRVMHAA